MIQEPLPLSYHQAESKPVKKVLMYFPDFGLFGGIERFILDLCLLLKQTGQFEPFIICSYDTLFYRQVKDAGFKVYGIKTLPLFIKNALRIFDLPTYIQVKRLLERENPDLVHIHVGQMENLMFKIWGYPLIYTFHGYSTVFNISATRNPLIKFVKICSRPGFRYFVSRLDALLFVSRMEQMRMLDAKYLPDGVTGEVVYNSLNVLEFQRKVAAVDPEAFKSKYSIPPHARCISFIGRMDPNKNPVQFIRLSEQLASLSEDYHFIMAGSGVLEQEVNQQVSQSPVRDKIHVIGNCSEIPALLAATELAVYIPTLEAFGLGVLETIAAGTLCVAYASGGIREIMDFAEGESCLVPTGDFKRLLETSIRLLNLSPEEKHRLQQALMARARHFDQALFLEKMLQVYDRVLQPSLK